MEDNKNQNQQANNFSPSGAQAGAGGGGGSKGIIIAIVAVLVLAGLGVAYVMMSGGQNPLASGSENGDNSNQATENEEEATGPVARVNGEEIEREEYNNVVAQLEAQAGNQASAEDIEQQALDTLISNTLIQQQIAGSEYTPSAEEIDAEVETIRGNFETEEAFQAELDNAGITLDDLRQQVSEQLAVDAYLRSQVDLEGISISDENVEAYYDQLSANNENLPSLEEVRPQIEQQLQLQAQQVRIQEFVDQLRSESDVEVLI